MRAPNPVVPHDEVEGGGEHDDQREPDDRVAAVPANESDEFVPTDECVMRFGVDDEIGAQAQKQQRPRRESPHTDAAQKSEWTNETRSCLGALWSWVIPSCSTPPYNSTSLSSKK